MSLCSLNRFIIVFGSKGVFPMQCGHGWSVGGSEACDVCVLTTVQSKVRSEVCYHDITIQSHLTNEGRLYSSGHSLGVMGIYTLISVFRTSF